MVSMSLPAMFPRKSQRKAGAQPQRAAQRNAARGTDTLRGKGQQRGTNRLRNMSAARRNMYLRRRIFVSVVLILLLSLLVFCVISLGKGIAAIGTTFSGHEVNVTKKAVPDPRPVGLTKRCNARDIRLELSTKSQNVPMGGSVELTERFVYEGNTSCLIDASDMNAVLAINNATDSENNTANGGDKSNDGNNGKSNGGNTDNTGKDAHKEADDTQVKNARKNDFLSHAVWRSDVCDGTLKPLLMAKGDRYEKKITWNTNATSGVGCVADENLPKVNRGTYVARIVHKRVPGLHSEPVLINVQ